MLQLLLPLLLIHTCCLKLPGLLLLLLSLVVLQLQLLLLLKQRQNRNLRTGSHLQLRAKSYLN
jgi:hypothetical protein